MHIAVGVGRLLEVLHEATSNCIITITNRPLNPVCNSANPVILKIWNLLVDLAEGFQIGRFAQRVIGACINIIRGHTTSEVPIQELD